MHQTTTNRPQDPKEDQYNFERQSLWSLKETDGEGAVRIELAQDTFR
jgi:hypothetical protein